jgi:hypothetical protein
MSLIISRPKMKQVEKVVTAKQVQLAVAVFAKVSGGGTSVGQPY